MAKIGVFDLCSFFWTVAGTRKRGEDPYGLALQVLRYIRSCAEKVGVEDVIFGADGPSGRSFRRSVCPEYKAGREAKDPEHRAELDALTTALLDAGFTVHKAVASSGSSATGGEPEWFEGDDVVASFAVTILRDPDSEVVVGSNDWDLAPLLAFPKVRLFTTRGEERTAADVKREFGVEPLMLPQLKALAGDSDGYKPFPGLEKGKPGIGDKTAAAILEKFGSAEAAVMAALNSHPALAADEIPLVPASAFDGLPSRTIALLRAGGVKGLTMGMVCAKLRTDAPVPAEIGFGEWAEVEAALLGRQKAQQSEPRLEVASPPADAAKAFREAAHAQIANTNFGGMNSAQVAQLAAGLPTYPLVSGGVGRDSDPCPDGKCSHNRGEHAGPTGEGGCGVVGCPCMSEENPNYRDPVCPRCLGVEPGKPAGDPDHPHPGPFTAEVCAACEAVLSKPIPVTPLSVGRPVLAPGAGDPFEAIDFLPDGPKEGTQTAPRRRRSKAAPTITIAQDFASADPDKVAAAFKEGVEKAAEKRAARGEPDSGFTDLDDELSRQAEYLPGGDEVVVVLTAAEFWALAPLVAASSAGLLGGETPSLMRVLAAIRSGAFVKAHPNVFVATLSPETASGLGWLGGLARCAALGTPNGQPSDVEVALVSVPGFLAFSDFGQPLVRA